MSHSSSEVLQPALGGNSIMVMVVAATAAAAAGGGSGGGASKRVSVRCNLLVFHRPFPAPARQQPARPGLIAVFICASTARRN